MSGARKPVSAAQAAPAGSVLAPLGVARVAPSVGRGDLVQSPQADASGAVAAVVGVARRVVVNGKGNRYQLQQRLDGHGWVGLLFFATKAALLAKFAGDPELAAAVAHLPERPAGVCPDFVAERQRQAAVFRAADYGRDAYPRVVAQVDDWRLVVDPDGSAYRLMFVHCGYYCGGQTGWNMWISSAFSSDLDVLRALVGRRSGAAFGSFPELWPSLPDKMAGALLALPRFVCDVDVPEMPARPVSLRRQRLALRAGGGPFVALRSPSRPEGA
jgi:hypothetical protein